MNFKIENSYLNITSYPSIERHFEKMASRGWLITKIIDRSIFIYRRIKPEELDFSISPYEVETAFTKKSKEELKEFQTVCESVGWNYATKTYDLHIYFKEKGSEAVPIQTDEEEEFKTLEFIGKRQLRIQYFIVPFLIFVAWLGIGSMFININPMKDGLYQIMTLLIPVAVILSVVDIINLRKFLKINRKNIEIGKDIEFNTSRLYIYKICFLFFYIIILGIIINLLYVVIVLQDKVTLIGFIPVLIGLIVGRLYRIFVKPSKKSLSYKKVAAFVTIILAVILAASVGGLSIIGSINQKNNFDTGEYRVLSINNFIDKEIEEDGELRRYASMLIPTSYEYSSYIRGHGHIVTEYSNALSENLAENLVNRYKNQAKNKIIGRNSQGLNLKDKNQKEAVDMAMEIIINESIVEDKENLWNMDEVHFLSYDKMEIVIRNGKEVFYLEGRDFSDPEVIEIVKDRLDLN